MTTTEPKPKRGPGQPRKAPTTVIGFRVAAPLAAHLRNRVAPHDMRPWLERVIAAQFPK